MTDRPNILLISTDTSRCDTLGCYAPSTGYAHALSPHLDRLASEGVVFDQSHTPAPVCMPARCSLLTGVHTPVHGCLENGVARHTQLKVFPDLLAPQGSTNVIVVKTHIGPVATTVARAPPLTRTFTQSPTFRHQVRGRPWQSRCGRPDLGLRFAIIRR